MDYEDPQRCIGFVMGHNMLDEYWDRSDHSHRRDTPDRGRNGSLPRQDFSSRLTGPLVGDLFLNFAQAWQKETGETLSPPDFSKRPLGRDGRNRVVMGQVLRTQSQYGVEDIKKGYLQAVNNASQFIYIENQYFRWPPLAETIKACAAGQTGWGRRPETHGPLYLFVITNANSEGMGSGVVNTYRMLDSLGRADTLPEVTRLERADDVSARLNRTRIEAAQVRQQLPDLQFAARRNPNGPLARQYAEKKQRLDALEATEKEQAQQLEQLQDKEVAIVPEERPGLKAHICTLVAPDTPDGMAWMDVYIHAKLMIVDDAFMTLGSANINTRSMQVDSELNIAHHRPEITRPERIRLWNLHTNNQGGQGKPGEAFEWWGKFMMKNNERRNKKKSPAASLIEFYSGTIDRKNID